MTTLCLPSAEGTAVEVIEAMEGDGVERDRWLKAREMIIIDRNVLLEAVAEVVADLWKRDDNNLSPAVLMIVAYEIRKLKEK